MVMFRRSRVVKLFACCFVFLALWKLLLVQLHTSSERMFDVTEALPHPKVNLSYSTLPIVPGVKTVPDFSGTTDLTQLLSKTLPEQSTLHDKNEARASEETSLPRECNKLNGQYISKVVPSERKVRHDRVDAAAKQLGEAMASGDSLPLLTLFSTWPDVSEDEEHERMRNLTMRNWSQLRPFVVPVLITNSSQHAAWAEINGWQVIPVRRTAVGVPVLKDMYKDVMSRFDSTLYAFANGDIVFTYSLVNTLLAVLNSPELTSVYSKPTPLTSSSTSQPSVFRRPLMVIGTRTNVNDVRPADMNFDRLPILAHTQGTPTGPDAVDYFIVDRNFPWSGVPDLVIGRMWYDNWMVSFGILRRLVVINASKTLLAVHQTGKAGNGEGEFFRANKTYNYDLLKQLQMINDTRRRQPTCAPWRTRYDLQLHITVECMDIPGDCVQ